MITGAAANQEPKFTITDTKLCVPVVILSTQNNVKLLKQLESGFKRTINLVSEFLFYHLKMQIFEKVTSNIIFQLWNKKDYNVPIDGRNFFDQPIKSHLKPYDNIRMIATGQGDDCTTECLLDYPYFEKYQKFIAIYFQEEQLKKYDFVLF